MKQSSFMTAGDLSPRGRPPRSPERPTLPARSWSPSRTSSAAFYNLQSTLPAVVEFLLTSVRSHFKLCGYKKSSTKYMANQDCGKAGCLLPVGEIREYPREELGAIWDQLSRQNSGYLTNFGGPCDGRAGSVGLRLLCPHLTTVFLKIGMHNRVRPRSTGLTKKEKRWNTLLGATSEIAHSAPNAL